MQHPDGFFPGFTEHSAMARDPSDNDASQDEQNNAAHEYSTALNNFIFASMSNSLDRSYDMNAMQSASASTAYHQTSNWADQVAAERNTLMQGSLYDPNTAPFITTSAEQQPYPHQFDQRQQENHVIDARPATTYGIPIDLSRNGYPFQATSEGSNHRSMHVSERHFTNDDAAESIVNSRPVSDLTTGKPQRVSLNEYRSGVDDASGSNLSGPTSTTSAVSLRTGDTKGKKAASSDFSHLRRRCSACGTSDSPEWRKGADGNKSLCNACGLRHSRNMTRARRKELMDRRTDEVAANEGVIPVELRDQLSTERHRKRAKSLSSTMQTVKEATSAGANLLLPATMKEAMSIIKPISLFTLRNDEGRAVRHTAHVSGSSPRNSSICDASDGLVASPPPISARFPTTTDQAQDFDGGRPVSPTINYQSEQNPTPDTMHWPYQPSSAEGHPFVTFPPVLY